MACKYYNKDGTESFLYLQLYHHFKDFGQSDLDAERNANQLWLRGQTPEFLKWHKENKGEDSYNGEPSMYSLLKFNEPKKNTGNLDTTSLGPSQAKQAILKYVYANNGYIKPQSYIQAANAVSKYNKEQGKSALELKKLTNGSYVININNSPTYFMEDTNPIETVKDFLGVLIGEDGLTSHSNYTDEQTVNYLYDSMNKDNGLMTIRKTGEVVKITNFKNINEAKAEIKEKVLPKLYDFNIQFPDNVVNFLNNGGDTKDVSKFFGAKSNIKDSVLEDMKDHFDYDPSDYQIRFSDVMSRSDLNLNLNGLFEGFNPIITFHRGLGEQAVSIFDMVPTSLGRRGPGEFGNIFKKFLDNDNTASQQGITLGRNEGDIRSFQLGLTAMMIKKLNPNVSIKNIAVLNPNSKANKVDARYVWINEDFIHNIKAMRKIPELMDMISPELNSIIMDDSLLEDKYDQPYMNFLKRRFEQYVSDAVSDGIGTSTEGFFKEALDSITKFKNGSGDKIHIVNMIKARMHDLERRFTSSELLNNDEYHFLSQTYKELVGLPTIEVNKIQDLNTIQSFATTTHNYANPYMQFAITELKNGKNFIENKIKEFQDNSFHPVLDNYLEQMSYNNISNRINDKSGTVFKHLFITTKAKDKQGLDVDINTGELHWDKSNPKTKKALESGIITSVDLEFSNYVLDQIEIQMLDNIMHEHRFNAGFTKEKAKEFYDKNWRRGLIPVIGATTSELIFSMKGNLMKKGVSNYWSRIANANDVYELGESKKLVTGNKILSEVSDQFMYQMGSDFHDESGGYGSTERLRILGLHGDSLKGLILTDKDRNDTFSKNIEDILNYFTGFSIRKRHMEDQVLPSVNAAYSIMWNFNKSDGKDLQNTIKTLDAFVNHTIHGQRVGLGASVTLPTPILAAITGNPSLRLDSDVFVNTALAVTSTTGIALSLPVGITAGVMNISQLFTNSIANAGTRFYGFKEASEALGMLADPKNVKKMEALMHMYSVADSSERDLLFNTKHLKVRKTLFNSKSLHVLSWAPDYYVRGIVMTAQMLKDGTWGAYDVVDGKLVYDESQDPLLQGDIGQQRKNLLREKLIEQGIQDPGETKLKRGYDTNESRTFKWLADKYITGSYDETTASNLNRYTVGRIFTQYKQYMFDKFHNYFGSTKWTDEGGHWMIKKNEDGTYKQPEWEQNIQEGILKTLANYAAELRKNKFQSFKKISELKPHERRNMNKFALDLLTFALLYTIYCGLGADDDDWKKKGKESRMARVFKYGAMDMISYVPWEMTNPLTSIPVMEQLNRFTHLFVGDLSQMSKMVPGSSTVQMISEAIEDPEELIDVQ